MDYLSRLGEELPVPGRLTASVAALAMSGAATGALVEAAPARASGNQARLANTCCTAALTPFDDISYSPLSGGLKLSLDEPSLQLELQPFGLDGNACSTLGQRVVQVWHEKETWNRKGFVRDSAIVTITGNGETNNMSGTDPNALGTPVAQLPTYAGCLNDGQAPFYREVVKTKWIPTGGSTATTS